MATWKPSVDIDYLKSLLNQSENSHLDFKRTIDLSTPKGKISFVLDVVSMANRAPGGSLVVGVDDSGAILPPGEFSAPQGIYDPSKLREIIKKYVDGEVNLESRVHDIEGSTVLIITIHFPGNGFPLVFSVQGEYTNKVQGTNCPECHKRKNKIMFRKGDIYIREGATNTRIDNSHWDILLEEHNRKIRNESMEHVNKISSEIMKMIKDIRSSGYTDIMNKTSVELNIHSSPKVIYQAAELYMRENLNDDIIRFIDKLFNYGNPREYFLDALTRLVVIGCVALDFRKTEIYTYCVTKISDLVSVDSENSLNDRSLDILNMIYVLGSLAVRKKMWKEVRITAMQKISNPVWNRYGWVRALQTVSSRRQEFEPGHAGLMITTSYELIKELSEFRPDIPEESLPSEVLDNPNIILESLCKFDFLNYWIMSYYASEWHGAYPACSAYNVSRFEQEIFDIWKDDNKLKNLFSESEMESARKVFFEIFQTARQESENNYGSDWYSLDFDEMYNQFTESNY
ncbi:helix-turn-helix domain-containing protein [Rothia sp. HMSC065G12]|uniref:AlbA family DNA-binding domain-containing protein n=1 Tax=Rothia sp. HMSC065G12 TaxID=1739308 RepID=UPI0008A1E324|nr:ATP-binding protein [Rothia sp. HMSC065G12]OFK72935.1 hypothetical protein HMPREF2804_07865 [Rothia sp. HMSC065G12]